MRRQNPLKLLFEDISTFDAENSIVRSLLRELDVRKKVVASDLVKNAPGTPGQDFAIQNQLDKLRDVETEPKKKKNSNNNLSLPPSPPSISPGPGAFIPPPPP